MNFKEFVEFNDSPEYKFFQERTERHIGLVNKYANMIAEKYPELSELLEQVKTHDASKYEDPEVEPYVYVTWSYKCKDDGVEFTPPEGMKERMTEATTHHVLNNRHHPEFHAGEDSDVINSEDRDAPVRNKVIDGTGMEDVDIAEMCADWCAVSEERKNTPQSWADANVNVRWKFNEDQTDLIYKLLNGVWDE